MSISPTERDGFHPDDHGLEPWDLRLERIRADATRRREDARDDLLIGIGEALATLMRAQPVQGQGPDQIRAAIFALHEARRMSQV